MLPSRLANADLRLLRVFAAVVEAGGFGQAQTLLNVAQPTLSTQIAALEAKLGVRLCERGRRGFRLTNEGHRVLEATRRLFQSIDRFDSELADVRGRLSGQLHLGIVDNTTSHPDCRLPVAIAHMRATAPDVRLQVHVATPLDLELGLVEGRLQLAIGPLQRRRPALRYEPLYRERHQLYAGRGHPLFALPDEALTLGQIAAAAFCVRGYREQPLPARLKDVVPAAEAHNMEAIAHMVLSGCYLGYLPAHYAAGWRQAGTLRALRPHELDFFSPFYLVTRRGEEAGRILAAFRQGLLPAGSSVQT